MKVPTYDKFIEPVFRFLAEQPNGVLARDAHEAAAEALGLDERARAELLPSGTQAVYKNRAGWAHDRLKRAGYSRSPRRGFWQLTDAGRAFLKTHPQAFTPQVLNEIARGNVNIRLRTAGDSEQAALVDPSDAEVGATASPDDRLEQALLELNDTVAGELLEAIGNSSPQFFEGLVLDVLHAMGYGTSREDLQRVGGTADAGIDGIISLDRLGLEKVYVQAKRWQNTVGRPEVQAFYGALAGQRANKGVFITTSTFTNQAIEFASSVERIVLVDGKRLSQLMIEFGVGVSHRMIRLAKLDSDYFE